jgi:hypothetical protein
MGARWLLDDVDVIPGFLIQIYQGKGNFWATPSPGNAENTPCFLKGTPEKTDYPSILKGTVG